MVGQVAIKLRGFYSFQISAFDELMLESTSILIEIKEVEMHLDLPRIS